MKEIVGPQEPLAVSQSGSDTQSQGLHASSRPPAPPELSIVISFAFVSKKTMFSYSSQ